MITLLSLTPQNTQGDVSPDAAIQAAFSATGNITASSATLDGELAYSDGAFTYPDFSGSVVSVGTHYAAFTLQPRRASPPGLVHTLVLSLSDDSPSTLSVTITYRTADQVTPLVDLAFRNSAIDQPFTTPALDAYRRVLVSATRTRPSVAALVQLFYRVYFSGLRAFISHLDAPVALIQQLSEVLPADVPSVMSVDAQLQQLAPLWDAAMSELTSLGAAPDSVQPLQVAHGSPYPQERAAAACAAVLYAATFQP